MGGEWIFAHFLQPSPQETHSTVQLKLWLVMPVDAVFSCLFMCMHALMSLCMCVYLHALCFSAAVRLIQVVVFAMWSSSGWSGMTFSSLCHYRDSWASEVWVIRVKMRKDLSAAVFVFLKLLSQTLQELCAINLFCLSLFYSFWNKSSHTAAIRLVSANNTDRCLQSGSGLRQQYAGACCIYSHLFWEHKFVLC